MPTRTVSTSPRLYASRTAGTGWYVSKSSEDPPSRGHRSVATGVLGRCMQTFDHFVQILHFSQISLIFRDFQVHSSFLISCITILKKMKIKINMSISFSYFTTMAWEKFVEKYDDFM